jgi:hypothetical protein
MSIEVLLIPLAIAGIAAIREARSTDLCEKCKVTRIADQSALVEALIKLGAENFVEVDGRVTCTLGDQALTFQKVNNVFLGRVDQGSEEDTEEMLALVDGGFGKVIQERTITHAKEFAASNGLRLISESAGDGSVQLLFEEA